MGLFDNNVVVRWTVRRGPESDRKNKKNFLEGELVYTTDEQRLYAGTGSGSVPLSVKFCNRDSDTRFGGDFYIDGNNLVIRRNERAGDTERTEDYLTISSQSVPDGISIIFRDGKLSVGSIKTEVYSSLDNTIFTNASGGIGIAKTLPLEEVTGSSFTMPSQLKVGGKRGTAFALKGTGSTSSTPKTFGLRAVSGGGYDVYVVDMPQPGSGGGVEYNFNTDNFVTTTDVQGNKTVNLTNRLVGINGLRTGVEKQGSTTQFLEIDFTNLDRELTSDFVVGVHENADGTYSLCKNSGSSPVGGGGSIFMLETPVFICWNGKPASSSTGTVFSATLEFNSRPYVYCNKKHMAIKGMLPPFEAGETYESESYIEKLESETGAPYDWWNNTLCVLGKNNYKNIKLSQVSDEEQKGGGFIKLCFTELANPVLNRMVFEGEALDPSAEMDAFIEPYEVLRGNISQESPKTFSRNPDGSYTMHQETISSVSIDGVDVPLEDLQTDNSGVCSISALDAHAEGKFTVDVDSGSFEIDLHGAIIGDNTKKRVTIIEPDANAECYHYQLSTGKYKKIDTGAKIIASSFRQGDIIATRTGKPRFSEKGTAAK